jgi:3-(3-hydroxy-phenyl)propionate hydroxylase
MGPADVEPEVRHYPVVIIGAGPTGVTAATLLAQYGVESLVLDRWPDVYPQPRAVHMDDEVCRIMARLGVADEFAAISRPALGLRLLDRNLDVLAEFQRDPGVSPHGFPQANMFDQPELESLLRDNLTHYPQAHLQGDVEVIDVADSGRGPVRITAVGRVDGAQHTVTADYVLGCDGANSLVRTRIGSTMRDLNFEQRWLVVDVDTAADLQQWEGVHQLCDPGRAGTYMRIGDRRYRWEFRLHDDESAADFSTIDALEPLIRPWTATVALEDLNLVRVTEYTFRAQLADRWHDGRIFLLGDAAHLTPPFIGQGMGAGIRDAMNLTWKLAGVLAGELDARVLDTYVEERKPHAHKMIGLALNVGRAMTAGGELGRLARRFVVPRMHVIPGLRARVLDSETPALCGSALVRTSWRTRALIGRLCPNPLLNNGSRLDDEIGCGFAILTTAAPTMAQREVADRRGAAVHVAEPGGELAAWLRSHHAAAVVIRPDRTVMRAGTDLGALCAALPEFHTPTTSRRAR